MAINWLLPVRAVQALFAIITLGLSAHIVSAFNNAGEYYGYGDISPSQFDYNVFVSLWTLLVLVYLIGILFVFKESQFAHPIISIALDGVTWVFWLAAFACVAALLNGVTDAGEFSALVAFGVLEWLLFSVTLGFGIFQLLRGRSKGGVSAQGV